MMKVQLSMKESLAKVEEGIKFFARGIRLFGSDIANSGRLVVFAATGVNVGGVGVGVGVHRWLDTGLCCAQGPFQGAEIHWMWFYSSLRNVESAFDPDVVEHPCQQLEAPNTRLLSNLVFYPCSHICRAADYHCFSRLKTKLLPT